jgi:hypothetical protein
MKRWIPVALFAVAILAFYVVGQFEKSRSKTVLNSAMQSVNVQLDREVAGKSSPADRTVFLKKQKELLGSIRSSPAPAPAPPQVVPTAPVPEAPVTAAPAPLVAAYMPIIITGVFGMVGLWMILSKSVDDEARKWAFSTLGLIVGYWLKG